MTCEGKYAYDENTTGLHTTCVAEIAAELLESVPVARDLLNTCTYNGQLGELVPSLSLAFQAEVTGAPLSNEVTGPR